MFVRIVDDVRAWFIARGLLDTEIVDGIGSRDAQLTGATAANRVAFVAASEPMATLDPTHIGEDETGKRQLLNVQFVFEVSFAGYDPALPERDLAHRAVCFDLWETTVQAVHHSYFGAHSWGSATWDDRRKHGRHGAELVATLTLNVPLFDLSSPLAAPVPVPGEPKPAPEPEDPPEDP